MLDLDEIANRTSSRAACDTAGIDVKTLRELIHEARAAREMRAVLAECLADTLNIPLAIRAGAVLRKFPEAKQ